MSKVSKQQSNKEIEVKENIIIDADNQVKTNRKTTVKEKIIRISIIIGICALVLFIGYIILKKSGLLTRITSIEALKQFILDGGIFSRLIFFLIQFLQVTFIPIPAIIPTIAGALIFGPYETAILSFFAVFLGSLVAFILGRKFGQRLISWVAGESEANKWFELLTKGKYVFFLMMLFPVFPDDLLCMIAGVTNMSYKFFIFTNIITRPISIVCTCFLGSGYLIPFSGWGLYVWPILIVLLIIAFYVSIKYQAKIENYIVRRSKKIENRQILEKKLEREKKIKDKDIILE